MTRIRWENVVFDTLGWIWGIREYVEEIRRSLPNAKCREREALNRLAKEFDWDFESYSLKASEIRSKFEYWIPRVIAYSIITMLHAAVETQLRSLANRLRKIHNKALKPNEITGDAIDRTKTYLVKVIGLPVNENPAWPVLRDIANIRHIIVHAQGVIGDDAKRRDTIKHLKRRYPNDLSEYIGELHISLHLCEYFLDKVEEFFRDLFKQAGLPLKAIVESKEEKTA